jgi:ABC-2 type transport system ATP-binding protein
METILNVQEVVKQYSSVRAVGGVSFEVRRGEIFALLGPNGAGKTTLVRMLMAITRPDSGSITYSLSGDSPQIPQPWQLGYLPEDRGLYQDQPILRTLAYFGTLRGMEPKAAMQAGEVWLHRLGLEERAKDKLSSLSKGNQQKVQFAASVLHGPQFAALDEPFSGLDPVNQEMFLQLIRDLRESGTTILLSAHQMNLVERIADRILLLNRGQEALSGTLDEIREKAEADNRIRLKYRGVADLSALERHPAVQGVERVSEQEVCLLTRTETSLSDLLITAGQNLDIMEVLSERVSLHDIYVQTVGAAGVESLALGAESEEVAV